MGHGKLRKFAEMETFPNVVQAPAKSPYATDVADNGEEIRGHWEDFFRSRQAILDGQCWSGGVLELGCGRGEYTVGLARRFPEKCFIGVDIKGARMWHGARQAIAEGLSNAAFLRTNIEFIDRFFAPGEVSEIWLTFSDPQMKKASKRLTSTNFLQRYRRIMPDQGIIHLKTDSNFLFTYTLELLRANGIEPEACIEDIYGADKFSSSAADLPTELSLLREVRTYYEQMWLDRGITIKYLRFRLPAEGALVEPDVEIPLDEYRSYNRVKRSSKETSK